MQPRPPTEEEKEEIASHIGIFELPSELLQDDATWKIAARDLVDQAAIAVFDDYEYENTSEIERDKFKKLIVVVFRERPSEPNIYMVQQDGFHAGTMVEFPIESEPYITEEENEAHIKAEEEYQRSLREPKMPKYDPDGPFLPDFPE